MYNMNNNGKELKLFCVCACVYVYNVLLCLSVKHTVWKRGVRARVCMKERISEGVLLANVRFILYHRLHWLSSNV